MFTYLLINFFSVFVPFLVSFHPKNGFIKYWKPFLWSASIVASLFIVWDILFTYQKFWGFTPQYLTGIYLVNLPIEEVLFFICIPFSCLFTYQVFKDNKLFPKASTKIQKLTLIILVLFSTIILISYYNKAYPLVTFSSLIVFCIYVFIKQKFELIFHAIITYLVLLIPFVIVNGMLTGSFLNKVIVWYNPDQIIGLRILTIPFEDIFYGFLLFSLNTFLFEHKKTHNF